MVGKQRFPEDPEDVAAQRDGAGSSAPTPGMNVLDQQREASLADEGGCSGARIESQDLEDLRRIASDLPVAHLQGEAVPCASRSGVSPVVVVATAVAAGVVGAVLYQRWR